jgi:hypothetical protein
MIPVARDAAPLERLPTVKVDPTTAAGAGDPAAAV